MTGAAGEAVPEDKLEEARKLAKSMPTGGGKLSATDEKDLEKWMARADDINLAIKYLCSGEGGDVEVDGGEDEPPPTPPKAVDRRIRYTANYSRFDDDKLIAQLERQVDEQDKPKEKVRPKTVKKLAETLMLEEAVKYKDRGNAAYKKGDYEEAEKMYSSGVTLNPDNYQVRNNRAMAFLKNKKWTECVEDCNIVLRHEARNVKALQRRGTALVNLRRSAEACEDLQLALKYDGGGNPEIRRQLERAHAERREEAKVRRLRDKAALGRAGDATQAAIRAMRRLRWFLRRPGAGAEGPMPAPIALDAAADADAEAEAEGAAEGGEEEAASAVSRAFADLRACLTEEAAATYFRWIEGVDAVVDFMEAVRGELRGAVAAMERSEAALARNPAWLLLPVQLLDLLATAVQGEYNLRCFVEDQRSRRGDVLLLPFVVEVCEAHAAGPASMAAARLLAVLTGAEAVRADLPRHLSVDRLLLFPHHADTPWCGDGALPALLTVLDNLLVSPAWHAQCAALPLADLVLPLLTPARSRACRDAAAAAVLRLSARPEHRAQLATGALSPPPAEVARRLGEHGWAWRSLAVKHAAEGPALRRVVQYLSTEVEQGEGGRLLLRSPYAVEALLAALHNCCVAEDPATRDAVAQTLADAGVCAMAASLLRSADVAAADPHLNIKARALGLLAKCVSLPAARDALLRQRDAPELLAQYAALVCDADAVPGEGADGEDGAGDERDPIEYREVIMYRNTCAEHAVSLLASLLRSDRAPAADAGGAEVIDVSAPGGACAPVSARVRAAAGALPALLRCVTAADDKCAGNAALCVSELARDVPRLPELGDAGCIEALLALIKRKRAAMHDEGAERRRRFREEGKGTPTTLEEAMKLNTQAQRNAAIGLARLAKDPTNRSVLRELQGIEILATTLKYVDDPAMHANPTAPATAAAARGA